MRRATVGHFPKKLSKAWGLEGTLARQDGDSLKDGVPIGSGRTATTWAMD